MAAESLTACVARSPPRLNPRPPHARHMALETSAGLCLQLVEAGAEGGATQPRTVPCMSAACLDAVSTACDDRRC